METKYVVSFALVIVLIGLYGIITMQLLATLLLIAVILAISFIIRIFSTIQQSLDRIQQRLDALEKKEEDLLSALQRMSGKKE
jgi:membrane protein implicated in regulation of membrane protease activity